MKTAMQELIEFVNSILANQGWEETILNKANQLLEKEKEQIIIAFIYNRYVLAGGHPIRRDEAEDYYNQTYNQNK